MSKESFKRLVRLVARAFYDDMEFNGGRILKSGCVGDRGIAVVVLESLMRDDWVKEENLSKNLKLNSKQIRRVLHFFEEEKFIMKHHRKQTAKGTKIFSNAVAATGKGQQVVRDGVEKMKLQTHSYCCLDYAQIYDIVRYRLHTMKKKLRYELDSRNIVQEYFCPNCRRRYSAFDALQLISFTDEYFHCENCNGELVAKSDRVAAEKMGAGDGNVRHEKLKEMLDRIEEQLNPLVAQLSRVENLPAPEFVSLEEWEATNDSTRIEVDISDMKTNDEGHISDTEGKPKKVHPPWLGKGGMNLTEQQSVTVDPVPTMDGSYSPSNEKKSETVKEYKKNIQDEIKAYYDDLGRREKEQEASQVLQLETENSKTPASDLISDVESPFERQVGKKARRENDDSDDVEWEDGFNCRLNSTFL